jgi:hypothetical protein
MKCLRGASALDEVLAKHDSAKIRLFVVWEKVLRSDQSPPSPATLSRVRFRDTQQYWDPNRVVSKAYGETSDENIVWDCVYVYKAGTRWDPASAAPPAHTYTGRPVVDVAAALDRALR